MAEIKRDTNVSRVDHAARTLAEIAVSPSAIESKDRLAKYRSMSPAEKALRDAELARMLAKVQAAAKAR